MKYIIVIPVYKPDNNLINLIKSIDKDKYDIIVIDDGSGNDYIDIFNECKKYCIVKSYKVNKGKGYALKEGLKYIKDNYNGEYIVITMDGDGQHLISDADKICEECKNNINSLIIGKRIRDKNTPIRSKIGNTLSTFIFKLKTGKYIYDTQSGLRAFHNKYINYMINIDGNRYEYEMNVLLKCSSDNIDIKEINISTIYIDNNKKSHFNAFSDAYKIFKNVIRYKKS